MPPTSKPIGGISTSLTNDEVIFPNAAPMMMPTAMSTTLPFTANSRNSFSIPILAPPDHRVPAAGVEQSRKPAGVSRARAKANRDLREHAEERPAALEQIGFELEVGE